MEAAGCQFYNPDLMTRELMATSPELTLDAANVAAWNKEVEFLKDAIKNGTAFAFETTLGGKTITSLLHDALKQGALVQMWYCGLDSPERHLARVAARVAAGGHDIPEKKIRERYDSSRRNLIKLIPELTSLRVYDNSAEAPAGGKFEPRLLFTTAYGRLHGKMAGPIPDWAKPLAGAVTL